MAILLQKYANWIFKHEKFYKRHGYAHFYAGFIFYAVIIERKGRILGI